MSNGLPSLFIGSSTEGLDIAYSVQENLDMEAEPTVWKQGIFQPSGNILAELLDSVQRFDFALFVFSPDDVITMRGETHKAVRDNVIFELGLFMGALGRERCFHLVPRNATGLHLPSDLAGISPLSFNAERSDGNLLAALGPACNAVRRAMRNAREITTLVQGITAVAPGLVESPAARLRRYEARWNDAELTTARRLVREQGVPMSRYELEAADAPAWAAFRKIYGFLDAVSDAVLAGDLDEADTRAAFGQAVVSVWKHAAMPNHVADTWETPPAIAQVANRWGAS